MLDHRASVMVASPPAGLALGLAVWLLFGRGTTVDVAQNLQTRLSALPTGTQGVLASDADAIAQVIAKPLFALTTGPGAVAEIAIKLEGVARSPGRVAALLSIGGKPAQWVEQGGSIEGVVLQDVAGSKVVVDTPLGLREVKLGETTGPAPPTQGAADTSAPQEMPPGYRSPPPPASAPAMGG
jgi:hypothetical protein